MRVNVEDDLWTSGRLTKLARVTRQSESSALGALVMVYRATQKAHIVEAEIETLVSVVVVHFESDDDARAFILAMVESKLADRLDDGKIHVRGNEKHVSRFERLLSNASKGGQASYQKKLNDSPSCSLPLGEQGPSNDQAKTEHIGTLPCSHAPMLLSPKNIHAEPQAEPTVSSREIRATRGFPENAFEAAFRSAAESAGKKLPKFSEAENSIGSKIIRRCSENKITAAQLCREWFNPAWEQFYGFSLGQLEKQFAQVYAAIADPKTRPKPKQAANDAENVFRQHIPSVEETIARQKAWKAELEKEPPVSDEESARLFAEMRAKLAAKS